MAAASGKNIYLAHLQGFSENVWLLLGSGGLPSFISVLDGSVH